MTKVSIIGAGSMAFIRALIADITYYPELEGSTICLMDVSAERLDMSMRLARKVLETRNFRCDLVPTTDRRQALTGADFVMTVIQIGGHAAFEHDIHIPAKYGVSQCVGDTLNPGGIFRGLRTIPVLQSIARDMEEHCPDALLLQYCNPMAINMWALYDSTSVRTVGLCHSVQGTSRRMAKLIGAPYEEITFTAGGINHLSFFTEFKWRGKDAYPLLWEAFNNPATYGEDPVRIDLARHLGYYSTESSAHLSEYIPWFRVRPDLIESLVARFTDPGADWVDWGRTGGYLRFAERDLKEAPIRRSSWINGEAPVPVDPAHEYGPAIVAAVVAHRPLRFYGNVRNTGLIPNLPDGACVEVPVVVDQHGMRPVHLGKLPPACAALCRTNISVQELTALGSLHGDRDLIRQAISLDPLTSSVCSLAEIEAMTNELFAANAPYLPQFTR